MLTLSVAKLDAAWYYNRVAPGGEPDDEGKYGRAKRWITLHGHRGLMASEVAIEDNHLSQFQAVADFRVNNRRVLDFFTIQPYRRNDSSRNQLCILGSRRLPSALEAFW